MQVSRLCVSKLWAMGTSLDIILWAGSTILNPPLCSMSRPTSLMSLFVYASIAKECRVANNANNNYCKKGVIEYGNRMWGGYHTRYGIPNRD